MASLLTKILYRISGKPAETDETPQIYLAVFGKHPGWDDHIEDLGLETERLVDAKRTLYVQGIGGNIDAGSWEELAQVQQLDGFGHLFVWRLAGDLLIGRMWSSTDGKGRTSYPMIALAQCRRLSLSWALEQVPPQLEQIQLRCSRTNDALDVQNIVNRYRAELRELIKSMPPAPPTLKGALRQLADHPDLGPEHLGLLRILYQIERNLTAFRRGQFNPDDAAGATLIRVPQCTPDPAEAISLWIRFLLEQLDDKTPILTLLPLTESWLDLIIGPSPISELYCVRAGPQALPLTTQIPYHLDQNFIARARQIIEQARRDI